MLQLCWHIPANFICTGEHPESTYARNHRIFYQSLKYLSIKPSFHIIATITWIAANGSSNLSDSSCLMETCTNDFSDSKDRDRLDRTLLYSLRSTTDCINSQSIPSSVTEVVHSDANDRNDHMETRLIADRECVLISCIVM